MGPVTAARCQHPDTPSNNLLQFNSTDEENPSSRRRQQRIIINKITAALLLRGRGKGSEKGGNSSEAVSLKRTRPGGTRAERASISSTSARAVSASDKRSTAPPADWFDATHRVFLTHIWLLAQAAICIYQIFTADTGAGFDPTHVLGCLPRPASRGTLDCQVRL